MRDGNLLAVEGAVGAIVGCDIEQSAKTADHGGGLGSDRVGGHRRGLRHDRDSAGAVVGLAVVVLRLRAVVAVGSLGFVELKAQRAVLCLGNLIGDVDARTVVLEADAAADVDGIGVGVAVRIRHRQRCGDLAGQRLLDRVRRFVVDRVMIGGIAAVVVVLVVIVYVVVPDRQVLGDADPAIVVDVDGERRAAVADSADDDAALVVEQDRLAFGGRQSGIGAAAAMDSAKLCG